jgi:hypothetical protein
MSDLLKKIYVQHKNFWSKENKISLLIGAGFFAVAIIIQNIADRYVLKVGGTPVSDMLLSRLPTMDVDFFVIQWPLIVTFVTAALILYKPKYLCFCIKALAVFLIIRSFLISVTHLGVNPDQLVLDTRVYGFRLFNFLFNTTGDFFFSAHTGVPFLLALVFWREKIWRYFFLFSSMVMGTSMLLAHIHYSIDVFAAPFMTYSLFAISKYIFDKDYKISLSDQEISLK